MARIANIPLILLFSIGIMVASVYCDYGNEAWVWFQRSGSVMVLCGAILTYRSVFRLGLQGVGGAEPHFLKGIITSTRENGTVDFKCDLESQRKLQEAFRDKLGGFIGIFFIVFGTFVWGYGDLIGRILSIA